MRSLTIAALFSMLLAVHPLADVFAGGYAQGPANSKDVVLQCELAKGGEVVARPSLRIASGHSGSLLYRDELIATLTPTRLGANEVSLALTIVAAGKTIKPKIRIGDQPGTVSIPAGEVTYELRLSLGQ